jgi:hypothetical protein
MVDRAGAIRRLWPGPAPSWGQALAAEKLTEHHGLGVTRDLGGWMIVDGLGRTVCIVSARLISRTDGVIAWDPLPPW